MNTNVESRSLTRYAWLSIAAALATITLKSCAYWFTGSVGLYSDAVESLVNLIGGVMALWMLKIAERPADDNHAYGHTKAEYFSSGLEGMLILLAAFSIAWAALLRLWAPLPIEQVGLGFALSVAASAVNLGAALLLLRAGKRYHSVTLEANAHHLLTDVWTSVGVVIGILAVAATGWHRIDPIVAMLVAANIVWAAWRILRKSVGGLMDVALPGHEQEAVRAAIAPHLHDDVQYHALRTRRSGARRFVSLHVLVPGEWTVHRGHALCDQIESDIRASVPNASVFTHLESLQDPASYDDMVLDRRKPTSVTQATPPVVAPGGAPSVAAVPKAPDVAPATRDQ